MSINSEDSPGRKKLPQNLTPFEGGKKTLSKTLPFKPGALLESKVMTVTATSISPEVLNRYEPVIGLEVHVQLLTNTKAFCACENRFGAKRNRSVAPCALGFR